MTGFFPIPALFLFISGICIGSFINVCIYRIPENMSIVHPGSFCPECGKPIAFYWNIPLLGYIMLKGRCRFCNIKIPARYPLVELITGTFAVLVFYRFGFTPAAVYWFAFICVLITISFIDLDHQIIPDIISLPGIIIFASSFWFVPEMSVQKTITGILAGGGSLGLVAFCYYLVRKQQGMGGGDIKLMAMLGAATGIKGVVFIIFAGSFLGTLSAAVLMVHNNSFDIKFKIPFGPFLSLGAVIYIFFGTSLIQWYFNLI